MCTQENKVIYVSNDFNSVYSFLTNEYIHPIRFEGDVYLNAESAFAASMTTNHEKRKMYENISANHAQILYYDTHPADSIIDNYYGNKTKTILTIAFNKFYYNEGLKSMLLNTDDKLIVYIPSKSIYHDRVSNIFGKALMTVREAIRNGETRKTKATYDITDNGISVFELDISDKIYNRSKINEKFYNININ